MAGSTQDLAAALVRAGGGDRVAYEQVYRATNRKLYGVILRIVSSRSIADEVMQDVYVKVWQKACDFDMERASPITWMATIARNRALDEMRKPDRAGHASLEDGMDIAADLAHPLEDAERSEAYHALMRCLDRLDREKRDILLLAYYRGLSREALAARFSHPAATIKTWLHRSLVQLRACLAS